MLLEFKQYLDTKAIKVINTKESQVIFTKDNLYFVFIYHQNDPFYFRLILPQVGKIEDNQKLPILTILNSQNSRFKVAKALIINENEIWIHVEQFVYSKENIDELFDRAISVLEHYKITLQDELNKTLNNNAE